MESSQKDERKDLVHEIWTGQQPILEQDKINKNQMICKTGPAGYPLVSKVGCWESSFCEWVCPFY